MKQNKRYAMIRPALGVALLATLLTGCVKRELEDAPVEGHVEIALVWEGDEAPQAARFLFYGEDGTLVKEQAGVTSRFRGNLPAGTYRVVVHNTDARQVDFRGLDTYEGAEVFAQEAPYELPAFRSTTAPCILEPQFIFSAGRCREVEKITVVAGDTLTATVAPTLLTRQVQFHFVAKGAIAVESVRGVLGGVAPGAFLASGNHTTSAVCAMEFAAVPVAKVVRTASTSEFTSGLTLFNLLTTAQSPDDTTVMEISLTLEGGKAYTTRIDLTPTLRQIIAASGGEIPIEIPLEVTLEVHDVSGDLSATVAPWDNTGTGSGDVEQ